MWESYVSSAREVQLLRGSLGRKVELEILKCVDGFGIATVGKIMMIQQEGMSVQCVRGPGVNMKVGSCWRVALLQISSHSCQVRFTKVFHFWGWNEAWTVQIQAVTMEWMAAGTYYPS